MEDKKLKIEIDGYDLDFEISPFSYNDTDELINSELKINFSSTPENLIKFLKLYKALGEIQQKRWTHKEKEADDENPVYYLEDNWKLKLEFKGFKEEKI